MRYILLPRSNAVDVLLPSVLLPSVCQVAYKVVYIRCNYLRYFMRAVPTKNYTLPDVQKKFWLFLPMVIHDVIIYILQIPSFSKLI